MNFSTANQIVQTAHDLFTGRRIVPHMQRIEIDALGFEAAQAAFHGTHHVPPAVAGTLKATVSRNGPLGRDDEVVAIRCHEFANQAFTLAIRIVVRGVDERSPSRRESFKYLLAFFARGAEFARVSKDHRAQAQLGYAKTAAAEHDVSHRSAFSVRRLARCPGNWGIYNGVASCHAFAALATRASPYLSMTTSIVSASARIGQPGSDAK